MNKQLIVIGTAVLLLVVGLCGCNEINPFSDENKLVGTWKCENDLYGTITFFSDGKYNGIGVWWGGVPGNYEIKDGKLVMSYIIEGTKLSLVYDYSFANNDTALTLTSIANDSQVFTKQ